LGGGIVSLKSNQGRCDGRKRQLGGNLDTWAARSERKMGASLEWGRGHAFTVSISGNGGRGKAIVSGGFNSAEKMRSRINGSIQGSNPRRMPQAGGGKWGTKNKTKKSYKGGGGNGKGCDGTIIYTKGEVTQDTQLGS